MNPSDHSHEGGLSVRDQIERYRTAFISVVVMFVIAVAVGGYILAHENLHLPSWVPVLGHDYYHFKAEFQTAQAVTPGQGQAVTIAGAKVGEVASVELKHGIAIVSMKVTPKYAHFYKNATLLIRPKTQLQDITIEVSPGDPSAGKLKSGETLPLQQTAPNVNFDEFLAGLDAETRAYLRLLLAGAGKGFENNGTAFAATLKRFEPAARLGREIQHELAKRSENISHSIHNFRLLMEALGTKDKQIAELVDSSNAVFQTFAKEDANFEATLKLLPGALNKTGKALGKVGEASDQVDAGADEAEPVRQSSGAGRGSEQKAGDQDDADHRERNPPVRARNPPDGQRTRPEHAGAGRIVPAPLRRLLGAERILQRAGLQPRQGQGRLRLLPRLGQPQPQQRRQQQRRARDRRAQPDLLQLRNPADPGRGSPKSTKTSRC